MQCSACHGKEWEGSGNTMVSANGSEDAAIAAGVGVGTDSEADIEKEGAVVHEELARFK